jgi:hypothetical protein
MLSAAAASRRDRSSSVSLNVMNRRLIPARSCTSSGYAQTFYIGNVILLQTLRLPGEPIAGKMGIVRVKLSFVALIAAAAVSGACQSEREREAERSRVERDRGSAAFKAGQAAHKLANGAAKVAEAAGRKLDNAAGKAREGWKEQERKDRERK